jgi:hypothetical protein
VRGIASEKDSEVDPNQVPDQKDNHPNANAQKGW